MSKYKIIDSFWIDEDLRIKAILTTQSDYWYVRYNKAGLGQRKQSLHTRSKKQARMNGSRFVREFLNGDIPDRARPPMTIQEAIESKCRRLRDLGRRDKTVGLYERALAKLASWMRSRALIHVRDLTSARLEEFERELRDKGIPTGTRQPSSFTGVDKRRGPRAARPLKPKTIRDTMKVVRGLIKFAVQRDGRLNHPCPEYELPPGPTAAIKVFTPAELTLLFADPDRALSDVWKFLTMTCLRASEFCWLMKADVLYSAEGTPRAVMIRRKICPLTGELWLPKHGVQRLVPLKEEAAAIIASAMASANGIWAFEAPDTAGPRKGHWQPQRLSRRLKDRLAACGITHGSLHTFRHTGATQYANDASMPVAQLQRSLGHRDIKMTMQYVHPAEEDIAASVARVDFSSLTESPAPHSPTHVIPSQVNIATKPDTRGSQEVLKPIES